ncbi:hypothetical protein [Novosphingobium sp. ES2-1]|uniref:hypothetical protein n=1 Tax=Novosphingobium sp. ES2-1 TaxID=2780074 RepID=UPI00187E7DF8|nr:hypothetical protein [Novosphingobium sp. ES2-1]QOV96423.1 hypothetical protein IM701_20375 [Novosphingobium sp. ES2-1]
MDRLIPHDDLSALAGISAEGFAPWGELVTIGPQQAERFARVCGTAANAGDALPGFLILSLVPRLVPAPDWSITGHSGVLNLGCPSIRFPAIARAGAALQGRRQLSAVRKHPRGTLITLEFEVREAGMEQSCMIALNELLYLSGRST